MSLRKKIISGFVCVFIIGLILGITGLVAINMIAGKSDEQRVLQQDGASVSSVLNAHYIWRQGLTEAVLTESEFTGSLDSTTCALGKWRNSDEAKSITDPEILSLLQKVDAPHSFIHTEAGNVVAFIQEGKLDEAEKLFVENILPKTEETINLLTEMEARYDKLMEDKASEILSLQNRVMMLIYILLAIGVLASVLLAALIIGSIMKPIRMITEAAETISTGDLDVNISYPINDEIGSLTTSFQNMVEGTRKQASALEALANGDLTTEVTPRCEKDAMSFAMKKMIDNLNNMFGEINDSTIHVSTGAGQIADAAQMLAQGATEQAATVEQLGSSIAEVAEKTKNNADMAGQASSLADTIKGNAQKGSEQMDRMIQSVQEINEASQSIGKVIKIIDDIAFQTNILALNAAVEAARAGQHGKGFAVVADEVRNLAAKSAAAAKNTSELIETSIQKAEFGARISEETSASLQEIVEGIMRNSQLVGSIAQSSGDQAVAIGQISEGIDQVSQVVQQNSATAEQSAAASEEMSSQAVLLQQLISHFKLRDAKPSYSAPSSAPAQYHSPASTGIALDSGSKY